MRMSLHTSHVLEGFHVRVGGWGNLLGPFGANGSFQYESMDAQAPTQELDPVASNDLAQSRAGTDEHDGHDGHVITTTHDGRHSSCSLAPS